ncbi:hypothetical protein GCM10012280_68140 [Wenjunlia tyrosinilytica]|uniref:Uncharacterized protein n=1 Tax=Wenjunlia tyrosinilytica TaxID=1544741 RepID=A0A917ZZ39_9ACTN|nr:hypothetical protein GCM10012280_68140 [Wenjunlia tyrosinilytica]
MPRLRRLAWDVMGTGGEVVLDPLSIREVAAIVALRHVSAERRMARCGVLAQPSDKRSQPLRRRGR